MKTCSHCKKSKSLNEYHRGGNPDGLHNYCKECAKAVQKVWRKNNPDKVKAALVRNREKHNTNVRNYHRRLRNEALEAYGGRCQCCGETASEFLAIDHIEGGGQKHKREVGMNGSAYYRWLKNNGYPKSCRILCHNCNMALGMYGYCPHTKERDKSS